MNVYPVSLAVSLWFLAAPVVATAQSKPEVSDLFRRIFATTVPSATPDKVNHLIYSPLPQLLNEQSFFQERCHLPVEQRPADEITARGMLCKMNEVYQTVNAQDLFQQGAQANIEPLDLNQLSKNLQAKDLLIVVVPGIFGEFIKKRAFEEVFPVSNGDGTFSNDSSFARDWRAALGAKSAQESQGKSCTGASQETSVCDEQEKLARLTVDPANRGQQNISMQDLMNVGSIDDSNGRAVTRVVLFQMDSMTLESLGTQENNARIFTRRLEKFFQIMGHTPKNIAFVGYSRGTPFALEMLSQAKALNKPWLKNVKALVSLGGVVFGSALADDAIVNKTSIANMQLHYLENLKSSLTALPNINKMPYAPENIKWLSYNTLAWWKFIAALAKVQSSGAPVPVEPKGFSAETIRRETGNVIAWLKTNLNNRGIADPAFGMKLVMEQSMKFGLVSGNVEQEVTNLSEALQSLLTGNPAPLAVFLRDHIPSAEATTPNSYSVRYNTDIRRFKKLATAVKQGVTELTTDSRLAWWRTHEIPMTLKYFSISGTMAEKDSELATNRYAYNPGSPDDNGLLQNWLDYKAVGISSEYAGVALNDSQVAIHKSIFWPQLIATLNPNNGTINSTALAILGTHHWGMALPIVVQVRRLGPIVGDSGLMETNPFPRAALMQSIALTIGNDLPDGDEPKSEGH